MTIEKIKRILKANGWKESPNVPNGWYRGMASFFFSTDEQGEYIIKLSDENWGYVSMISKINATPMSLQITWKSMESWKIIY